MVAEQIAEVMIIHARVAGLGERDDLLALVSPDGVDGCPSTIAMDQARCTVLAVAGQESPHLSRRQSEQRGRLSHGHLPGQGLIECLQPCLIPSGQRHCLLHGVTLSLTLESMALRLLTVRLRCDSVGTIIRWSDKCLRLDDVDAT